MSRSAPKILKVKDLKEDDRFSDIHENLPKMPCLGLLIGSVRSGKSNLHKTFYFVSRERGKRKGEGEDVA